MRIIFSAIALSAFVSVAVMAEEDAPVPETAPHAGSDMPATRAACHQPPPPRFQPNEREGASTILWYETQDSLEARIADYAKTLEPGSTTKFGPKILVQWMDAERQLAIRGCPMNHPPELYKKIFAASYVAGRDFMLAHATNDELANFDLEATLRMATAQNHNEAVDHAANIRAIQLEVIARGIMQPRAVLPRDELRLPKYPDGFYFPN